MGEAKEEGNQSGNVEQCYCYADREVCGSGEERMKENEGGKTGIEIEIEGMKALYEQLDSSEISVFDNARRAVIREMEEIKDLDAESCVVYLVDAVGEIAKMQRFALLNTKINISDIRLFEKRRMDIDSLKEWLETALNNEDWLYKYTGKHPRDELFGGLQLVLDLIKEEGLPEIKMGKD